MKFDEIPGWFDFHNIYTRAVERAIEMFKEDHTYQSNFVELGSYKGQSTAYMAGLIKDAMNEHPGLMINFYAVDLWKVAHDNDHNRYMDDVDIYNEFLSNMKACGVSDFVSPLQMSTDAASMWFFQNNIQFDFVFVDANHTFFYVNKDVYNYKKLMKPRGVIAGHDIYFAGVKKAVQLNFGTNWTRNKSSWIHKMV